MDVILNGQQHTVANALTVKDLIQELDLTGKFAIEINQTIIPKSHYSQAIIQVGDKIEVVQAIGGG